MDFIVYVILLLAGGCFTGLIAGLLGVGGGVILSPVQYVLLLSMGVDADVALPVSFATSLAVIFVTMISGTYEHYKNGMVELHSVKFLMILGVAGAASGALISTNVDVHLLEVLFGIMCMFSVMSMIFIRYPENNDDMNRNPVAHGLLGLAGGLLCGLMGVGGGIIMIPALTVLFRYPTRKAIGTSSAAIIATSLGGIFAYIILGQGVAGLPAFSFGYVNLLQFVFIALSSSVVAKFAAGWSERIDERILKGIQIILVAYIGVKMLGII